MTIRNLNNQGKLFREGLKPVTRSNLTDTWTPISVPLLYRTNSETGMFEIEWIHRFYAENQYFAFTYPWSCQENEEFMREIEQLALSANIYLNRVCLVHSCEGRRCDLLTITSMQGIRPEKEAKISQLYPLEETMPNIFEGKRIIFLTARVHPGETASSHMLTGFLRSLLSPTCPYKEVLHLYIFKIIPLLNPDGVYRGYYRTGITGLNENRFYLSPNREEMPVISAVKDLFCALQEKVVVYIDLHAHATKQGCFVFGNHVADFGKQAEIMLFAKLLERNNPYFDLGTCSFAEKDMISRDKGTGLSKEGCGRVVMYQVARIPLCYTMECNYTAGKRQGDSEIVTYDLQAFHTMGASLLPALYDYSGLNPSLSLPRLRLEAAQIVAAMAPYRNYTEVRLNRKSEDGLLRLLSDSSLTRRKETEDKSVEEPKI